MSASRVGQLRRPQQAEAQGVAERAPAVLAVASAARRRSRARRQVGEAVAGDLEAGEVVARREVRRAPGDAERGLVRRLVGADGEREGDLEQPVGLVPVGGRVDLEAPRAGVEADVWRRRERCADRALEVDLGAQRVLAATPRRRRPARSRRGSRGGTGRCPRRPTPTGGPRRARGGWPARPAPRGRSRGGRARRSRRRASASRAGARSRARRRRPRCARPTRDAVVGRRRRRRPGPQGGA